MRHFVFDVSGHGWGHATQVAPLVSLVRERHPDCRITLRSGLPGKVLERLIGRPFDRATPPPDPCLLMTGPMDIDRGATTDAYLRLHADWEGVTQAEAERLATLGPDILISDICYVGLAAARRADVPAIAISSLNWADMFSAYCGDHPKAGAIHAEIHAAYADARVFLQVTPHMPMADLPNRHSIGVMAAKGRNRRDDICRRLGLSAETRLVLVTLGGIPGERPGGTLPRLPKVHWILGENEGMETVSRSDLTAVEDLGLGFLDVVASSDAVVAKTGYGTFTQIATAGTRALYFCRPDWPESPYLESWIESHATATPIDRQSLGSDRFGDALLELLSHPTKEPIEPRGAEEALEALTAIIGSA